MSFKHLSSSHSTTKCSLSTFTFIFKLFFLMHLSLKYQTRTGLEEQISNPLSSYSNIFNKSKVVFLSRKMNISHLTLLRSKITSFLMLLGKIKTFYHGLQGHEKPDSASPYSSSPCHSSSYLSFLHFFQTNMISIIIKLLHILLFFNAHGRLVPVLPVNTQIHQWLGCSSPLYKVV